MRYGHTNLFHKNCKNADNKSKIQSTIESTCIVCVINGYGIILLLIRSFLLVFISLLFYGTPKKAIFSRRRGCT